MKIYVKKPVTKVEQAMTIVFIIILVGVIWIMVFG